MRGSLAVIVTVVAVGANCKKQEQASSPASSEGAPAAQARRSTTESQRSVRRTPEAMRGHFASSTLIRDALIAGDLELAQWNATWLAAHEPDPGIASWGPAMTDLRARARKVADATDLVAASTAAAELATECGRCHAANGVSPRFAEIDPRVPASGRRPHMLEHQWAAEQMWGGLIGASEASWNKGVAGFAVAPLGQDEVFKNASATQEIAALAADVHKLGAEGGSAKTWSERATVYGRLLATCSTCHVATSP